MTTSRLPRLILSTLCVSLWLVGTAAAQEWRGQGRLAGKVTDESGAPLEGVVIRATLPASGNRGPGEQKTNAKGDWSLGGIARGTWALDFVKEGYETRSVSVPVSEGVRLPTMAITLTKIVVVVDPNAVIKERLIVAAALMADRQFAEARAVYEALAREYPDVKQFRPLIARAYHGEGNTPKAIETLQQAVAADPDNVEIQVLLGTILIEAGRNDEGRQVLSSVDASKVTDPTVFVNLGIGLMNDRKYAEALTWLTRGVTTFPEHPDAYYYRGISYLSLTQTAEAKADLQKFIALAPADAPELATAKKILETIK